MVNYSRLHTLIPARFPPLSLLTSVFLLLSHFEDDTVGTGSAESNVSCLLILEFEKERGTFFKTVFDVGNLSNVLIKVLSQSFFLLIK